MVADSQSHDKALKSTASDPAKKEESSAPIDVVLSVRNLGLQIAERQILTDVSFDLARNSMIAIIGPSGSGKTSLLKAIAGLHEAGTSQTSGKIEFFEASRQTPTELYGRRYDTRFAYVSQTPSPFHTSIYDNIAIAVNYHLGGKGGALTRPEKDDRVEWALIKSCLWSEVKDRLDSPAVLLSSGQQQRLCIARAIAIRPAVLLLDEPGAHLDVTTLKKLEDTVMDIKSDTNVIVVTHNMQQAARISDTCLYIRDGTLVEYGATADVFMKPRNQDTEDYITGRFG